jgi:hypothetical protein
MSQFEFDPEDLFPPRPGGMVQTARKQAQAEADQLAGLGGGVAGAQGAEADILDAVPVRVMGPDTGTARTFTLTSAYPVAQLLGADQRRRVAIVMAIDNDVYLTSNEGIAHDVAGNTTAGQAFYLPAKIAMPIADRGNYWIAATTTATATRVSVLISRDSQ